MMKTSKMNRFWIGISCVLFLGSACTDDFLTVPVEDAITTDNFYETDEQLLSGTAPLYGQSFFKYKDKFEYSMEMLAGNCIGFAADAAWKQFTVNPGNGVLNEGWSAFYRAITDANVMLEVLDGNLSPDISQAVKDRVKAEALFTRAYCYYYLVRLWGPVPVIDKVTSNTEELYKLNTVESIYELIESNWKEAASLLPLVSEDIRRIGKTAPWAYLAEMYLTLKDYEKAREYAQMVIDSGVHVLEANYETQFIDPDSSINRETIYAHQFEVNLGLWGTQNTNQAYLTVASQDITGDTGSFGSVAVSIDFIQMMFRRSEEVDQTDLRRKWLLAEPGNFYDNVRTTSVEGGYLVPPSADAPTCRMMKYVVGSQADGQNTGFMRTEMSSQQMRYADVLFILAEAILGDAASTQDVEALAAFNQVRERAGLPPQTLITQASIIEERRVEFLMEACKHWLDLKRLPRNVANDLLRDQERGTLESYDPFVLAGSVTLGDIVNTAAFDFPYPIAELPFLDTESDPVPYVPSN